METNEKSGCQKPLLIGGTVVVLLVLCTIVFFQIRKKNEMAAQEKKAEEVFAPAISKLAKGEPEANATTYDIDRTISVIHGIDQALKEQGTLQDYLRYMSTQDYRNVAPEVLKARQKVLAILKKLYAKQTALENQEATFTVTRTILSTMTLVNADLTLATGIPSLDKEQAKSILKDLRNDQKEREDMLNELTNLETELIGVMTEYSKTYYKYVEEWDKVLTVRDAAYLASTGGDWKAVIEKTEQVIKMAPHDSEARLLGALAHLEMDNVEPESRHLEKASDLIADYVKAHPSKTAPALLLQAIVKSKSGQSKEAIRLFEQSAAYFPKQSDALSDMLNPYEVRSFLRKSSEGKRIVDLYKSTMLGAGFFSPDLQLAKQYFSKGEPEKGRKKVLDHFSRRRSQNEWDLVLSDVDFCQKFLGADFDAILVEDSHLELLVSPALIGSSIKASIKNGSQKELHNATLVLALQFTDMHRDDFESFKVGETVPVVSGNAETDFGSLDIDFDFLGTVKNKEDIVVNRAILITDEAVVWVDTDAYKLALARDSKRSAQQDPKVEVKRKGWFEAMKISPDILMTSLKENMSSDIDLSIGKDDVIFELPKELALLNPIFRLQVGDKLSAPGTNSLGTDKIKLKFEDVANYDSKDANQDAKLIVNSQFGDFEIMLGKNKEKFGLKNIRYISK